MDKETMEKEGWRLAATTSGGDLGRILDMYHELSFDVCTEEVSPEECGGCTECFVAGGETLYRVYARARDRADSSTGQTP